VPIPEVFVASVVMGLGLGLVKVMSSSKSFDEVEGGDGEACAGTLNRSCPW